MKDRHEIKQEEFRLLAAEYKKRPELFTQTTFVEDAALLEEFGIIIPGKDLCPSGLLKLWPEDFIVEEISESGDISTVSFKPPSPIDPAPTIYATLVKCGLSTIEAIEDIAHQLNIKKEQIAFAGIKDKDALTAQRLSFRGVSPAEISTVKSPHFFLKDLMGGKGVVEKGHLRGNRFTILVRTEENFFQEEVFKNFTHNLERVKKNGFYNYFYLQRFGTPRLRNIEWAYHILRGNFEQAYFDFLTFGGARELPYFRGLREQIQEQFGNWPEIKNLLSPFPLIFSHELKTIEHLLEKKDDFAGAFQTIPEQITLWIYALASLFFNRKISEFVVRGATPPRNLPFFLSNNPRDVDVYKNILSNYDIYPVPFQNLRRFPQIQIRSRLVPTQDLVEIHKAELVDEGILLQFSLGKGQYATTFLSHLFNLLSGVPPENISKERIDGGGNLGETNLKETIALFEKVIRPKGENIFEEFLEE